MNDCYKNIIGFTEDECPCLEDSRPADFNESQSGLYLDELKPIASLDGLMKCEKTIWYQLEKARTSAVKSFVSDTNALLGKKFSLKRETFSGVIGEIKKKEPFISDRNYLVVRIACAPIKSGILLLKGVDTIFEGTGTVNLELHSNLDGLISSHVLNTTANKLTTNEIGVELPLYSKYFNSKGLEYFLVVQYDSNNKPKDTELNCGCGGNSSSLKFNKEHPYFNSIGRHRENKWAEWIMCGGMTTNSVSELQEELPEMISNKMFGLVLDVELKCKIQEVICDKQMDFLGNPLAMSAAYAIYYKAGFNMLEYILKSEELSRESMVNSESLEESQIEWIEKYNEQVKYIVSNINIKANDCFKCKEVMKMTKEGIFS